MLAKEKVFSGFEPFANPVDSHYRKWLYASYTDETCPYSYTWPKYVEYDDSLYKWSSWNSDEMYVCYKECVAPKMATPVRYKKYEV